MSAGEIIQRGRRVVRMESDALATTAERLGPDFARAIELIAKAPGRVIVSGVGKSGLVGRKIAATLTSTGTPASFLHPVESVHGDLGIVGNGDVALLISKRRFGVRTIAITGVPDSALGRHCDAMLDAGVKEEACPHDLAPTTSTTVAMALGDALAVALLEEKGFRREDFARLHPGGTLGRRLLTKVEELMVTESLPVLGLDATMRDAIVCIAERRGLAVFVDGDGRVEGVMTGGDLTRLMERVDDVMSVPVAEVMNRRPKVARRDELASAVVYRMETHGIMSMPVVGDANSFVGVVHLHDLMRARVV